MGFVLFCLGFVVVALYFACLLSEDKERERGCRVELGGAGVGESGRRNKDENILNEIKKNKEMVTEGAWGLQELLQLVKE